MTETQTTIENVVKTTIFKNKWYIPYIQNGIDRVIDWNHPIWAENPSSGTIVIEAIHPDRFLDTKLKPFTDEETGVHIGIGTGVFDKETQRPILGGYKVGTLTTTLHLENPKDRKLALFIILNPMVRNSRNKFSETLTMLVVKDEVSGVVEDIETRRYKRDALALIDSMDDKELEGIARITVGVLPGQTTLIIKNNVEKYAENNPKQFIEDVNQQDKSYKIYFQTAKDLGIIKYTINQGFVFGAIPLGRQELDAVEYLKEHSADIYATLVRDVESTKNNNSKKEVGSSNEEVGNVKEVLTERDEYKRK